MSEHQTHELNLRLLRLVPVEIVLVAGSALHLQL